MFCCIISCPALRRENNYARVGAEQIKKTKGTEIYIPIFINCTCKTNRSWRYNMLQVVLFLNGFEVFQVEYHWANISKDEFKNQIPFKSLGGLL